MAYEFEFVLAEIRDGVLELALNRPESANAIDSLLAAEIDAALDEAEVDDDVRAVLLRGEGGLFAAGHDLREAAEWRNTRKTVPQGKGERFLQDEGFPNETPSRGRMFLRAWYFRKPLICAVHRYVGPGATSIVCCADFIIAAEGTRFGFEINRKRGGHPGYWWLPMYVQLPMRVIEQLFLMGGWMDAEEAHQFRFVQRVVPEQNLLAEARRWADQAALIPSASFGHSKDQIRRAYELLGLSALPASFARFGPPQTPEAPYTNLAQVGMHEVVRVRDEGIDEEVSRV